MQLKCGVVAKLYKERMGILSVKMAGELLGIARCALESNFTRLSRPYKLNFAVTMRCQSRCLTCNIWQIKPQNELGLDEIEEFSRKNRYFKWIGLTGGEPFLRSDIVEIARSFKENSKGLYLITIPTNSLCNQEKEIERIREMLQLRIPKVVITVSLDGDMELHDKVRGIPGNFDKAIGLFKSLKELQKEYSNLSVVFGYTISKINEGNLERTYKNVKMHVPEIRYNDFHINLAQLSDNYYHNVDNAIMANREIAIKEIAHAKDNRDAKFDIMEGLESRFLEGLETFASRGIPSIKCKSLDASLFMDSHGNVYPSIMWNYKIGNIRETGYDLGPIWESSQANDARLKIKLGQDPKHWTSCEAYQSILGDILHPVRAENKNMKSINIEKEELAPVQE